MATLSVKTIAANCLGKSTPLSLLEDVFGVYANDNPQNRLLKNQLDWIQNKHFVRVALITILGATPNLQRDLDNANTVYRNECGTWVYCVGSQTVNRTHLLWLDQDDCTMNGHNVSDEEDELFDLGRDMEASIVCYYINGDGAFAGCAAHPPNRRGFWVGAGSPWTFAHELTHVVGGNLHPNGDTSIPAPTSDNLMSIPTANITNPPPDLTDDQCKRIHNDPDMESC